MDRDAEPPIVHHTHRVPVLHDARRRGGRKLGKREQRREEEGERTNHVALLKSETLNERRTRERKRSAIRSPRVGEQRAKERKVGSPHPSLEP